MATVTLENRAQIDQDFLMCILNKPKLPSGQILLIFNDRSLLNNNLGECRPKSLLKYAGNKTVFHRFIEKRWDCGIAFSQKACLLEKHFPSYFTYLIGHELGHAYVCLTDMSVHIFYCLIQDFIRDASGNKITQWHELPHEVRFDQFGIDIAEQVFSREKLDAEITERLNLPQCKDRIRLERMLSLSGSNSLTDLRNDLIDFSKPYKDKLIKLWQQDVAERGSNSLASDSSIDNYDALFERFA